MPALEATADQRRTVRTMAGVGVPQEDIATFLHIDAKTLCKHIRAELDRASIEATSKVAQSLFRIATEDNNVAAAISWMKARAGWSEKQRVEHGLAGSFSLISGVPHADDLTDDQLARIAMSGRDEDEENARDPPAAPGRGASHRSYVIDPPPDLTTEQWSARCGQTTTPTRKP